MELQPPPAAILNDSSVFLDFDGTLVELASSRHEIAVPPDLPNLLSGAHSALGGRLALLSGRPAFEIRRRLGLIGVAIGGNGGGLGSSRRGPEQQRSLGLRMAARELRRFASGIPGLVVEEKPSCLTVYYRRAPQAERSCRSVAERLARATGMVLHQGRELIELKARSTDKGRTVRLFMRRQPFRGTVPVVVADDVTYEHAFVVAREMGGCGVLVGPKRPTAALYRLDSVPSVHRWLGAAGRRDRSGP